MLPPGRFEFRAVRHLGAGGLGTVDEIVVVESNCSLGVGERLARKRLNERWKNNPTARDRFEREILATQKMKHPAIIQCKGENIDGEERFYAMPLYPQNLRQFL